MANKGGTISFEHVGIGKALSQGRLTVPVNQRDYSWEDKHVVTLFQDLSKAIEAGKSAYFLGTIVLTSAKRGDTLEVADGQQRLATSTILLAAIRDYFHERGDDVLVGAIEHDFLFTIVKHEQSSEAYAQRVGDHEYFQKERIVSSS